MESKWYRKVDTAPSATFMKSGENATFRIVYSYT
jgi:hypothetical protein